MSIEIGIGPDSWGVWAPDSPNQIPWQRCLDETAEAGYKWTELGPFGYFPTDPAVLRRELYSRGLKLSAATVMQGHLDSVSDWPRVEEQLNDAGGLGAAMGARHLVLIDDTYMGLDTGETTTAAEIDDDGWKRLVDSTHRVADIARERFGLPIAYHPHVETHVQYEAEIEAFLEATDPDRVSLVLDTGHHAYAGGEPVSFMAKNHRRVSYLHVKSVDEELRARVKAEGLPMMKATAMGIFVEPPAGVVDFEAFSKVLGEVGYDGLITVEQDMFEPPLDVPLPIAKRTRDYLRRIGLG